MRDDMGYYRESRAPNRNMTVGVLLFNLVLVVAFMTGLFGAVEFIGVLYGVLVASLFSVIFLVVATGFIMLRTDLGDALIKLIKLRRGEVDD